ncbi:MAG: hypothetical protein WCF10_12445 [Polyangiales bacterium]
MKSPLAKTRKRVWISSIVRKPASMPGAVYTCSDVCVAMYPNGYELYGTSLICMLCTERPNNRAINGICPS